MAVDDKLIKKEDYFGYVVGQDPNTKEESVSAMYSRINYDNLEDIFRFPRKDEEDYEYYETKAVAYLSDDGEWQVAFMTEIDKAHHRHALCSLILYDLDRLDEEFFDDNYKQEKKNRALDLFDGEVEKIGPVLEKSVGFKLRYDLGTKKINFIYQQSWMTNLVVPKVDLQIDATIELISRIDPDLLSERYRKLDIEYQNSLIKRYGVKE